MPNYDIEYDPYDTEIVEKEYYDSKDNLQNTIEGSMVGANRQPKRKRKLKITAATVKRRQRLGLPVIVEELNQSTEATSRNRVSFDPKPKVLTSPKETHEKMEYYTTAEDSVIHAPINSQKSYKMQPHYNIEEEINVDDATYVWEKNEMNLDHFKELKQFEKHHGN